MKLFKRKEKPAGVIDATLIDGDLRRTLGKEAAFEAETGKHAIWRGKETKAFIKWKEGKK